MFCGIDKCGSAKSNRMSMDSLDTLNSFRSHHRYSYIADTFYRMPVNSLTRSSSLPGSPVIPEKMIRQPPGSPGQRRRTAGSPGLYRHHGSSQTSTWGSSIYSRAPTLPRKNYRPPPRSPKVPPKTRMMVTRRKGSQTINDTLEVRTKENLILSNS